MKKTLGLLLIIFSQIILAQQNIEINVELSEPIGEMRPFWSYFGYDEPNYTTQKDGQKLLTELKELSPTTVYVRTHNLLTSKGNSKGYDLK
jgi:xylan 1,4-beta-xylosidase